MKSLEDEIKELEVNFQAKKEGLEIKHSILSKLIPLGEYEPPSIHIYNLYESKGGINFRYKSFSYYTIKEGKNPDLALLGELLKNYPPIPLIMIKDGCTSIRPEPEFYESNGNVTELDPVIVKIEPQSFNQRAEVEWYAEIEGLGLWIFSVGFPYHQPKLGSLIIHYERTISDRESSRISYCDFTPTSPANRIRWATGEMGQAKEPNSFTIYWERGRNVNILDLIT